MYFGLSEDQNFFQDNIKKFLEENSSVDILRKIAAGDRTFAKDIHDGIVNLGINGLLVPEEFGGLGLDVLFAAAISESLGCLLYTSPSPRDATLSRMPSSA